MPLKLPTPRFRVRTLALLIAAVAVALWAGLNLWSPTRRLGRLLRADQPAYVRRDAAAALGHEIPSWDVDRAVSLLIKAFDDPNPQVRVYAGMGLTELGPRAGGAASKVIARLNDEDRSVRFSAAYTLGVIIDARSVQRHEAVAALTATLEDKDPDVRLAAADALVKLGETQRAVGTLSAACVATDPYFRVRARSIIWRASHSRALRPLVATLTGQLRDKDAQRRGLALQTLALVASPETVRSTLNRILAEDDGELRQWAAARLEGITASP